MIALKSKIANFLLYVYIKFIKYDFSYLTIFGKIIFYPVWIIKAVLVWIISPFLIPCYLINKKAKIEFNKLTYNQKKNYLFLKNKL